MKNIAYKTITIICGKGCLARECKTTCPIDKMVSRLNGLAH